MIRMRLSIIIPTLDEATNIAACLAPLQPLRALGHEVIVVDGGSRDDTPVRAAPFADRVLTALRGRASQMNAGARIATGDVLLFLHADSRLAGDALDAITLAARDGADIWGRFDVRIESRRRVLRLVAAMMNIRSRLTGIATGDQGMFVNRALFARVGGFPEQPLMEDVELSRRLRRMARPHCLRTTLLTSGRRWEKHGVARTITLMWRLRWAYYRGVDPALLAARYAAHSPD